MTMMDMLSGVGHTAEWARLTIIDKDFGLFERIFGVIFITLVTGAVFAAFLADRFFTALQRFHEEQEDCS